MMDLSADELLIIHKIAADRVLFFAIYIFMNPGWILEL
jgi:hypothetical protein